MMSDSTPAAEAARADLGLQLMRRLADAGYFATDPDGEGPTNEQVDVFAAVAAELITDATKPLQARNSELEAKFAAERKLADALIHSAHDGTAIAARRPLERTIDAFSRLIANRVGRDDRFENDVDAIVPRLRALVKIAMAPLESAVETARLCVGQLADFAPENERNFARRTLAAIDTAVAAGRAPDKATDLKQALQVAVKTATSAAGQLEDLGLLNAALVPVPRGHCNRCDRCGWAFAEAKETGCVPGDCSYRPEDPDERRKMPRDTCAGCGAPFETSEEAAARRLKAAIRAFTVEAPNGDANGTAERALLTLEKLLDPVVWGAVAPHAEDLYKQIAGELAKLSEGFADDTGELRRAADAFFGEDFTRS
jgi:hypothetical protein